MPSLTKRIARHGLSRMRSALREVPPPLVDQWRSLLQGNLEVGTGTVIEHAVLEARAPGGHVAIGSQCNVRCNIFIEKAGGTFRAGSRTHIGGGTVFSLASRVQIGDDVLISFDVLVMDHNSHSVHFAERQDDGTEWLAGRKDWTHVPIAPVVVKDKAWVGARSIILKGVTVGEGSVVGAGSVVTRDVPDWAVVAGNPARVIRHLPH